MNEEERKSYYAIIPANVRYDPDLTPNAKLLYGEITALTNEKGYCWASNNYFARLYKCTPQAISKWTKILEKKKYITIEYIYKNNSKEIDQRIICLVDRVSTNVSRVSTDDSEVSTNVSRVSTNDYGRYQQKVKDNNTSINNTFNNTSEIYSPAKAEQDVIPYKEICDYLNKLTNSNYRHSTKKTKDLIKARFNEGFTLEDFKTVIEKKTIDWINDKEFKKYLRPETLFGTKFESYLNQPMKEMTTKDLAKNIDWSDF